MKITFQTAVLLVFVTLIHVAVIGSMAPLEKSAMGFLAEINVEELVESAIPEIVETGPGVETGPSGPEIPETIPGFPGQEMETVQAFPLEEMGAAEFVEATRSTAAQLPPAREALAESQAYSGRIEEPDMTELIQPEPEEAVAKKAETSAPAPKPAANDRGVREIRPLGRF
ncbi:MAG: hypothetical protein HRU46_17535 [Verrucomicrobiales bacterium]|nr:hypothetical protein [Verrucomicrobiales bacterium]